MLPTELLSASTAAAAVLSLKQTINAIPASAKFRPALWLFCAVPIVPFLSSILLIHDANTRFAHHDLDASHPLELLINSSEQQFKAMLSRQSKTFDEAKAEYSRRYGLEPPPGFEAWYEFAVANESPIIDDFNTIFTSISPFLQVSGEAVRDAMDVAEAQYTADLWTCKLLPSVSCSHPLRTNDRHYSLLLDTLLGNLSNVLPDVQMLVNHLDEPAVLIPPRDHAQPSVVVTSLAQTPTYETLTKHCKPTANEPSRSIPFIHNRTAAIDLCSHPEYASTEGHGLLLSPTSLRLIEGLVPILSTGSPSTMGDILFPSPAYMEDRFAYDPSHDMAWSSKRRNLYWAGSNTGGYAADASGPWPSFHRQRFVTLTQNLAPKLYRYIDQSGSVVSSTFLDGRLYDTAFTHIGQCQRAACRAQRLFFPVSSWAPKDKALGSTLVFDTDGNGISGRFYKLLASNSAPLKHTLLREWHDDRLMPWVHYVPVSQSLDDLPELVAYLTSNDGSRLAQRIAENGRDWFNKAFRTVDRAVYMYRLVLELARAQDPERASLVLGKTRHSL